MKCLKRKKLLDTRQAQHEQAIDKIHTMLHMLQETESQKRVPALLPVVLEFHFAISQDIAGMMEKQYADISSGSHLVVSDDWAILTIRSCDFRFVFCSNRGSVSFCFRDIDDVNFSDSRTFCHFW